MKVLFLDIDGVLNNTRSTFCKIGRYLKTTLQINAEASLVDFCEGELNYGPRFTIDTIDPVAVGLINRLCDKEPELQIVLSSSHRSMFCGSNYKKNDIELLFGFDDHKKLLVTYLNALGLYGERLFSVTPRMYIPRGKEVKQWMETNHHLDITHHVAVDDDSDFEPNDCNFVRTCGIEGLSSKNFFDISRILNINEGSIIKD